MSSMLSIYTGLHNFSYVRERAATVAAPRQWDPTQKFYLPTTNQDI